MCLPADFIDNIRLEIKNIQSELVHLKITSFEADPILARMSVRGNSNIVMSNNSDIFVHNSKTMLLHSFKHVKRSGPLTNIQLTMCNKETTIFIHACLKNRFINLSNKTLFTVPSYPIF